MRYEFGGLIFEGAYTWRGLFSEFYGILILFCGDDLLSPSNMRGHRGFLLEVPSHAGMFSPRAANPT